MEWFQDIAANYGGYIAVVLAVIVLANKIADITPTKTDDGWVKAVRRVAVILGLKFPDNTGKK